MFTLKTIINPPLRFILTIIGIALCAILMLFLLSVYKGVEYGSVEYVRACNADFWVLQEHATNILRSTSYLTYNQEKALSKLTGVKSVSPVLFILANITIGENTATVYLAGFDPGSGTGGPPAIVEGNNVSANDQIVFDRSFAAKHKIAVGDTISIKHNDMVVVGLSKGTNMFVIQYAFITSEDACSIAGFQHIASCYLIKVNSRTDPEGMKSYIESGIPDISVFDHSTFIENNIREMKSGILPLLYIVALIGAIVLTAILSLILSVNVLERRKDFAIMKAIGAPPGFIPRLVQKQAIFLAGSGLLLAGILFYPLVKLVEIITPEVSVKTSPGQIVIVSVVFGLISIMSSVIPNVKLRNIYPLEVFT